MGRQGREKKNTKINNYDVAITSYDMLKRDIEEYAKYNFRYVVADEAQYIKITIRRMQKL